MVAVLLLAAACTNSLSTKQDYISNYEAWVKNLKANYKAYKKPDWSAAEADFKIVSLLNSGSADWLLHDIKQTMINNGKQVFKII